MRVSTATARQVNDKNKTRNRNETGPTISEFAWTASSRQLPKERTTARTPELGVSGRMRWRCRAGLCSEVAVPCVHAAAHADRLQHWPVRYATNEQPRNLTTDHVDSEQWSTLPSKNHPPNRMQSSAAPRNIPRTKL